MKTIFKNKASIQYFGILFLIAAALQGCYVAQPVPQPYPVVQAPPPLPAPPPPWAPPYNNPQVQYYYLPDLEMYYDVWNHEYVYLENGSWLFTPALPPMYASYDLYGGHVVVLDYRVHQPWMHHEMYVEHYPRYYHQSGYQQNGQYPSGYDENSNQHYYGPRNNSNGPRNNSVPVNEPRDNSAAPNEPRNNSAAPNEPRNSSTAPNEPRNSSASPNEQRNSSAPPRPASEPNHANQPAARQQQVQYKGKNVGKPVPVQKNMMKPQQKEIKK